MSDTVSLPAETARAIAAWLRSHGGDAPSATVDEWADALDPRPTLREAVAKAIGISDGLRHADRVSRRNADAALAVVRDHIAALPPLADRFGHDAISRADILALLDGADR